MPRTTRSTQIILELKKWCLNQFNIPPIFIQVCFFSGAFSRHARIKQLARTIMKKLAHHPNSQKIMGMFVQAIFDVMYQDLYQVYTSKRVSQETVSSIFMVPIFVVKRQYHHISSCSDEERETIYRWTEELLMELYPFRRFRAIRTCLLEFTLQTIGYFWPNKKMSKKIFICFVACLPKLARQGHNWLVRLTGFNCQLENKLGDFLIASYQRLRKHKQLTNAFRVLSHLYKDNDRLYERLCHFPKDPYWLKGLEDTERGQLIAEQLRKMNTHRKEEYASLVLQRLYRQLFRIQDEAVWILCNESMEALLSLCWRKFTKSSAAVRSKHLSILVKVIFEASCEPILSFLRKGILGTLVRMTRKRELDPRQAESLVWALQRHAKNWNSHDRYFLFDRLASFWAEMKKYSFDPQRCTERQRVLLEDMRHTSSEFPIER